MPATIKDVAREAGVSIATVSKVLNGKPGISDVTVRRVQDIMRALDYAPNSRAASLARKSARCVAFLAELGGTMPYTNPHLFDIMCGVQQALNEKGFAVMLLDSLGSDVERMMLSHSFDGIIVHGGALTKAVAALLAARKFPHIVIGHPDDRHLNWVDTDHALGGHMACEHLIENGCRRIAFIGEKEADGISNQRFTGFRAALYDAGLECRQSRVLYTDGTLAAGKAAALSLLGCGERPDAVICSSNLLAYAFTLAAAQKRVNVPDGIQLITFDRYPYGGLIEPRPTFVQIDVRDMGRVAAKQLLQIIKRPELRVQAYTTLPDLIAGESTRRLS